MKFEAGAAKSKKRLKEMDVMRSARDCVERLMWSIFIQTIEFLGLSFNQDGAQLLDRFGIRLDSTCVVSALS